MGSLKWSVIQVTQGFLQGELHGVGDISVLVWFAGGCDSCQHVCSGWKPSETDGLAVKNVTSNTHPTIKTLTVRPLNHKVTKR